MPADAGVGDTHVCPIPPPAHVTVTPFVMGSATVMIGGMPALRVGDTYGCGATSAKGEPTVMIG